MNPDNRFSWRLAQSGRVSVTHQRHPGIVKNLVHIQCDCQSDSLLSDIVSADREGDVRPVAVTLMKKRVLKDATAASSGPASDGAVPSAAEAETDSSGENKQNEPREKTLVVRVKSAKHQKDELLLTEGKLILQGEDVIVRDGVPYFQAKSQVAVQPTVGSPALLGSQVDQKGLESLAAKDSQSNLYFCNSELLDGHRSIIQDPQFRFNSDVVAVKSAVRRRSLAESIDSDELSRILPNHDKLRSIDAERNRAVSQTGQEVKSEDRELNQVVMVNGRCVLKDNCIAVLRGLLHVGRTWHRVINGKLAGSNATHVAITGRPVYKDASDRSQMLLNNATLYSLGNTVYAGNAPLLEDAVLHADGQVINISELPSGSLCGIPAPKKPEPPRLFVQGGRFSVQNTGLSIREGTVWLQDVRMQLPEDTTEEVCVTESLVFISPATVGQDANKANEARDIIYADGMLLLDDLTPLLKDGFVCLGDQKQPLVWLSGDPAARSSQLTVPAKEELRDRVQMLTDATCILDQNGMYFIRGNMILQGKKVLIDRGVPLFSAETAEEIRKMNLGSPPPYLAGRVLMDAKTAKELGAKAIADFFVLKNVRLDMTDGKIILNNRVPVLSDCQLIMDRHLLSPMHLGFEAPGRAAAADAPAAAQTAKTRENAAKAKDSAAVARGNENIAKATDTARARKDVPVGAAKANDDNVTDFEKTRKLDATDSADSAKASDDATKGAEDASKVRNAMSKGRDLAEFAPAAAAKDEPSRVPPPPQPVPAAGAPEKTGVSIAATSTADMEDSGRGTSDWAESSQRAATALGGLVETPAARQSGPADAENAKSEETGAAASGREGGRDGGPRGSGGGEARVGGADAEAARQPAMDLETKPEEKIGGKPGGAGNDELDRVPAEQTGGGLKKRSKGRVAGESRADSGRDAEGELNGGSEQLPGFDPDRESLLDPSRTTLVAEKQPLSVESGRESGVESDEDSVENPNRLSGKPVLSDRNTGKEEGRDSTPDFNRDSPADFGKDSVQDPDGASAAEPRHAKSVGVASGKALGAEKTQQRAADGAGVGGRHEREVPASVTARPLGDISSNGITGNFSVTSSSADKKLVFSLKARIDEMLNFLDQQR